MEPSNDDNSSLTELICSECGIKNPVNAKFCMGCGKTTQKNIICPQCHNKNPSIAKFCYECGNKLQINTSTMQKNDLGLNEKQFNIFAKKNNLDPTKYLEDISSDTKLIKIFINDWTQYLENKHIHVNNVNLDDDMEFEIEKLKDEIKKRKKLLDNKLKILSSDVITINVSRDRNNPKSIHSNLKVDKKRIVREYCGCTPYN